MGFFEDFDMPFDPLDPFDPLAYIVFDEVTKEKDDHDRDGDFGIDDDNDSNF